MEAKYAEKYAEFGEICGAYGIFFRIFWEYANSSGEEL